MVHYEDRMDEVASTASPIVEFKFGSASSWTKRHLTLLGVRFSRNMIWNWDEVLDRGGPIPEEHQSRIHEGAKQLSMYDIDDLERNRISPYDLRRNLPDFRSTYRCILALTRSKEENQTVSTSSSLINPLVDHIKHTVDITAFEGNAKRSTSTSSNTQMPAGSATPDQPTIVPNPNYSGDTSGSGKSDESTDEELTKTFMKTFLYDAQNLLEDFWTLPWPLSEVKTQLDVGTHSMSFKLGLEIIIAKNDGGLHITKLDPKWRDWVYDGRKGGLPILSLEAKRKKHDSRHNDEVVRKHAAQIFAEMLGQVCHKIFYESRTEYQEAFVVHGTHDILALYYAKLPNDYLAAISQYGARFHQYSSTKSVRLWRTGRFHMRNKDQRVGFFTLLAKLLWYLRSGKSHAGYLYDYKENPIHKIVATGRRFSAREQSTNQEPPQKESLELAPPAKLEDSSMVQSPPAEISDDDSDESLRSATHSSDSGEDGPDQFG